MRNNDNACLSFKICFPVQSGFLSLLISILNPELTLDILVSILAGAGILSKSSPSLNLSQSCVKEIVLLESSNSGFEVILQTFPRLCAAKWPMPLEPVTIRPYLRLVVLSILLLVPSRK